MADLPLSQLTDDEKSLLNRLLAKHRLSSRHLANLESYRDSEQKIEHIGLAVPPELRMFEASVNMCGIAVREYVNRQELRGFVRTGQRETIDPALAEGWDYNNMASQSTLLHKEARTFGRGFVSVHTNPVAGEPPLLQVESTKGLAVEVDRAARQMRGAARIVRDWTGARRVTLYVPGHTIWLAPKGGGWKVEDRDDHDLDRVPLVMFLNDPSAGDYDGRSLFMELIPKVDAIGRTLTNMQVAAEAAGVPDKVIFGLSEDDLKDQDGNVVPPWEAYWTKLKTVADAAGKLMTAPAADLQNFTRMVDRLMVYCAVELGLPTRFAGLDTTNPASEGAITADEVRMVRRVERINRLDGDSWAWTMGLYEEFRTGERVAGNDVRALWFDPATPTYSQRVDGAMKLRSQGALSREGMWDEMGWSEERKKRERQYLQQEAAEATGDPALELFYQMNGASNGDPASSGNVPS